MKKKALIIDINENDKSVIEAFDSMNYSIFSTQIKDPLNLESIYKHSKLQSIIFKPKKSKIKLLTRIKLTIPKYLKIINKNNINIIFPSNNINDYRYILLGHLNQIYDLPGLNKNLAYFWCKKSNYLKYFNKLNIATPRILQIVHPMKELNISAITAFPVICKPDSGTGSKGVFLANSQKDLYNFFQVAPKNENINKLEKLHRSQLRDSQFANYLYDNVYSKYLIEEYIPGPLLSVAGIKAINGIEISLIFKITPADPPFRSENEFIAPFPFTKKQNLKKIHTLILKIVQRSVFPYGPFTLDFILDSNENFYLLDASPRLSATANNFLNPCYSDTSYAKRSICALLNQKINIQKRGDFANYVYLKRLPLKKGTLVNFSQSEAFSNYVFKWKFNLKPRDKIFRDRNDFLSQKRGELAVTGKTVEQAKTRWFKEFKKLSFSIEEDRSAII